MTSHTAHASAGQHWETSAAPFLIALGCLLAIPLPFASYFQYHSFGFAIGFLGIGVPVLLAGIAIWVNEGLTQKHDQFGYVSMGLPIFITSEAFIFLGIFASYWALRLLAPSWPPANTPHIGLTIPLIMTVILVSSSVTIHMAEDKLEEGDVSGFRSMLIVTILLAAVFLGCTLFEYSHLIGENFVPGTNIYSSAFFSITGFHAAHVLVGIGIFVSVLLPALGGKINKDFVKCAGVYWHFVDIVWFFVVSQVYFW